MVSGFVEHRVITNSVDHHHKVDNNRYSPSIESSEKKAALILSSLYSAYFLIKYNDRHKVIKYIDDDIDDERDNIEDELLTKKEISLITSDSEISRISVTDAKLAFTADRNNNSGDGSNTGDRGLSNNNHIKHNNNNNNHNHVSRDECDTIEVDRCIVSTASGVNGDVARGAHRDDEGEDDDEEAKQNLMTYYITVWIYIWSAFTHLVGP